MNNVTAEHTEKAINYFGLSAPPNVIAAKARCYAWRSFVAHTAEEGEAHKTDLVTVDAYEAKIIAEPTYRIGADPMGDE